MISLIVTTRNRPDFLYRCLLAISRQNCRKFECIVVGDHCQYAEAVCKLFDVRYIGYEGESIENVGAVGKNIGIEAAKYERICYCDDDNILLHNHIHAFDMVAAAFSATKFLEVKHGDSAAFNILNRPLYDTKNHRLGKSDALTICHSKALWKEIGGWQPSSKVGYNEDGYFIDKLERLAAKVEVPELTAIYYSYSKNFSEYNKLLPAANPIVYPELIKEWT